MNTRIAKIFDLAALCGLICIGFLFFGIVLTNIMEYLLFGFNNPDFKGFYSIQPLFLIVSLLFGVCVILLWVEAFLWIIYNWKNRSPEVNAALILFMMIGPVFAGYIIHYYKKKIAHLQPHG